MATNAERLASIEAAITAIESGAQEYRIGTRLVRRGDLKTLYAERTRLDSAVARESSGGLIRLGRFGDVR